jgi:hypothetical protein
MGWFSVAFFGLGALAVLPRFFDRADQIIVDDKGIYLKRWFRQTIPWSEVKNLGVVYVRRTPLLSIELAHRDRFHWSEISRPIFALNRGLGFGDLTINTSGTDKSFDELSQAVFAHWNGSPTRMV